MTKTQKTALRLISELEDTTKKNIFEDSDTPKEYQISAQLARIGALQLAILKIKIAFYIQIK